MPENSKDGPIDRLAKSLFASPGSPFTAFADKQRAERLGQCKDLENILMACQKANDNAATADVVEDTSSVANKSRSEARIKRFFKWNEPPSTSSNSGSVLQDASASILGGDDDNDDSIDRQTHNNQSQRGNNNASLYSKGCIKETHEMWACRALALGCGNHLSDLRRCWSDASSVQNKGELTFKDGDSGSDASCRGIQQQMARCVVKNTEELKERMAAASK